LEGSCVKEKYAEDIGCAEGIGPIPQNGQEAAVA
jgi:hypothetical protein